MKRILFLIILLTAVISVQAQYKDSPLHFSIMGNGHATWIFTDSDDISGGELGLGTGTEFHVDYFFLPQIAFSTGINWSYTGGHTTLDSDLPMSFTSGYDLLQAGTRLTYRLQYVEIPLGIKFASKEIGYTTYYSDFGVLPMIRTLANGNTSDEVHIKDNIFKEVTKFNVAYQAELGFKYSFGNKTCMIIALYYKNTFLDFTTDYLDKPDENSRINQAGLKLGFGF